MSLAREDPILSATWRDTWDLIKSDLRRRLVLEGSPVTAANAIRLALKPGIVCTVAFRVTSFLHVRRHRVLVRLIDDIQHLYTGIELHVGAEIGPGLVLGDRPGGGVSNYVTIGKNCTLLGAITIALNADGVDLSKGGIVLGDHCVVGGNVRIIGNLTLADGTQIKPNAVVVNSFTTPGCILDGIPATKRSIVPVEAMSRWSPLRACSIDGLEAARA